MRIKRLLKKIPGLEFLYKNIKFNKEYNYDCKFFIKNFSNYGFNKSKIGYNILLLVHSLEKALINEKLRPFGKEKVSELIELLKQYSELYNDLESYDFVAGINVLRIYVKTYEDNKWTNKNEYILVSNFLKNYKDIKTIDIGKLIINKKDIVNSIKIDYNSFLKSRHSIRNFSNKLLSDKDIRKAIEMSLLTPSACNRQMCKIYHIKDKTKIDYILKHGQGFSGFNFDNINIFVITFDVNANYFIGERNQGWFNAGLISMNFVNALHSLGIGSCFVQFGNTTEEEEEFKTILGISNSERIAVLLAAGYYNDVNIVTVSPRKSINDIFKTIE